MTSAFGLHFAVIARNRRNAQVTGMENSNCSSVNPVPTHHIPYMAQRHPHSDATYRIIPQKDLSFDVEVAIPGSSPTMVTRFPTEEKAQSWITGHRQRVEEGTFYKSTMRRNPPRTRSS
jgi:hypothetical protein